MCRRGRTIRRRRNNALHSSIAGMLLSYGCFGAAAAVRQRIWSVTLLEVAETLLLAVLIFLAVRASMQNFRVVGTMWVEGGIVQSSLSGLGKILTRQRWTSHRLDRRRGEVHVA